LIALINQTVKGRVGFVNPALYAAPSTSGAFHDVTVGDNRVSYESWQNVGYSAGPGWDAASGLGSPNGAILSKLLVPGTHAPAKPPRGRPHPKKPKRPRRRPTAKRSSR
jgi:kumamolisin